MVILGPDDTTNSRGESKPSPRDNAILELGILAGLLGRERVFWVVDRSNPVKLPSDLGGITPVDYDSQRSDSNLKAALDEAANMIEENSRAAREKTSVHLVNRGKPNCNKEPSLRPVFNTRRDIEV